MHAPCHMSLASNVHSSTKRAHTRKKCCALVCTAVLLISHIICVHASGGKKQRTYLNLRFGPSAAVVLTRIFSIQKRTGNGILEPVGSVNFFAPYHKIWDMVTYTALSIAVLIYVLELQSCIISHSSSRDRPYSLSR